MLKRMRRALTARDQQIIANLNRHLASIGQPIEISMATVEALTPAGNTTERHVMQVLAEALCARGKDACGEAVHALCGADAPALDDPATLQNFLRGKLIKAGGPDYAPESPEAFVSIADMRAMYLEMGAVPLYPVLGNPVTEGEENISG